MSASTMMSPVFVRLIHLLYCVLSRSYFAGFLRIGGGFGVSVGDGSVGGDSGGVGSVGVGRGLGCRGGVGIDFFSTSDAVLNFWISKLNKVVKQFLTI